MYEGRTSVEEGLRDTQVARRGGAGHLGLKSPEAQIAIVAAVGPNQRQAQEYAFYKAAAFRAANRLTLAVRAVK